MPPQLRPRHPNPTTDRAFRPDLGRLSVLPRELRDQIYSYLYGGWSILSRATSGANTQMITHPEPGPLSITITPVFINDDLESTRPRPKAIVDSLLVSRRYSEEVAHILYSTNWFIFERPGVLESFLDQIAEGHRHSITKVQLDGDHLGFRQPRHYGCVRVMQALVRLRGIKNLRLLSIMETYRTSDACDGFWEVRSPSCSLSSCSQRFNAMFASIIVRSWMSIWIRCEHF